MRYKATPPPEKLDKQEQEDIIEWTLKRYPHLRPKLRELWEDCSDYYLMQGEAGNQINWAACFRRWIRRANAGPQERKPEPYPQEKREAKKTELRLVRDILAKTQSKTGGK